MGPDCMPVRTIFVPGTWVPKLRIQGLSQRFLSQSQESQRFMSHETILGQPEFLALESQGQSRDFWIFWCSNWMLELNARKCSLAPSHGTQVPKIPIGPMGLESQGVSKLRIWLFLRFLFRDYPSDICPKPPKRPKRISPNHSSKSR